ncbi:MAG: SH3 domain-containing protein [Leptospiraceae bacterium]|nr:SH3 domain-containing protein [Leptospiraceae bacterium]
MTNKYLPFFFLALVFIFQCSKTNLEKLNQWLGKEEYEKLIEFSNHNINKLTDEELYLSSVAVSKLQNFLRKNKSNEKFSNTKYIQNLEKKTNLKIKYLTTENGKLIQLEDNFYKLIRTSKFYKDKAILDKFIFTANTNEIYENSFLLTDILEIDPRPYLVEFKTIWLESMKLGIPNNLNEEDKSKFIQTLHFLSTKEETDLKSHFFVTDGTNVNLRSGPGTENITIGKLTQEDVFQIDADYNTTTIGKKTGKWILVYVWSSDTVGWIFSAFLKDSKPDYLKAKSFEKTLVDNTNFRVIDFNNWNPEDIPDKFYGNYSITKKEIIDANVGFTVYPMEIEQGICTKLKKDTKKIELSFMGKNSNERLLLFYLKVVTNTKSKTSTKIELLNEKLYLNAKALDEVIENDKFQSLTIKFINSNSNKIQVSLNLTNHPLEISHMIDQETEDVQSWELCIPQGKKSSTKALLFSFNIY